MKTVVSAPAKINLMLDILSKLDNGYHSLWMIMQSVDLCDTVTAETTEEQGIALTCSRGDIPCDKRNIAYKAASAFYAYSGLKDAAGIKIHIDKHIPSSAGLAGGSADGAAVLVAMNRLYGTNYTADELCRIGVTIGADVPFCIVGGTCLAQDMGQVLSKLPDLPACKIVLAKPPRGISTKDAYRQFDTGNRIRKPDKYSMLHYTYQGNLEKICRYAENVFEQFIEVPERVKLKSVMRKHGAAAAVMSGSGPTVFGLFDENGHPEACLDACKTIVEDVFLCKPIAHGCKIME